MSKENEFSSTFKLGKANQRHIDGLWEINSIFQSLNSGFIPGSKHGDNKQDFDIDNEEDCRTALMRLLEIYDRFNMSRATHNLELLIRETNRFINHESDVEAL